jgi:phosphoribosyl-ATP pyrophosphohydrolase/phosphoribosyl-AMP cyclohydrolase
MSNPVEQPGFELRSDADLDRLSFEKNGGTVTVVTQDATDGRVLMVAHADREALSRSLATNQMWYRSRSRGLWHKGATSGALQHVVSLRADCDSDSVLALVRPAGPACHTGAVSCFGSYAAHTLARLEEIIAERAARTAPGTSYTAQLLADRNLRLKKLGEETAELTVACVEADAGRAAEEAADLMYHIAVALHAAGASLGAAQLALAQREKP